MGVHGKWLGCVRVSHSHTQRPTPDANADLYRTLVLDQIDSSMRYLCVHCMLRGLLACVRYCLEALKLQLILQLANRIDYKIVNNRILCVDFYCRL